MNISTLKESVLAALGGTNSSHGDALDSLLDECIEDILGIAELSFTCAEYKEPLPFLSREPYSSFLSGADGYYLISATLGHETDRRIRRLSLTDAAKMTVLDAVASALLEALAEERKNETDVGLSYIFCPGYGGSSASDARYILEALAPLGTGISMTESGLMLPQKSMVGIAARAADREPSCDGCIMKENCKFKREGKRCFHSEKA